MVLVRPCASPRERFVALLQKGAPVELRRQAPNSSNPETVGFPMTLHARLGWLVA
jgi:hypothetical protein